MLAFVLGSCQIVFDVSGPSARDLGFVSFSGDQIRGMAAWILYRCVVYSFGPQLGGYVTKDLNDTVKYLTDPTVRYEDQLRKSPISLLSSVGTNLPLTAPSTTFFTVWIWNKDTVSEWNPGDMERTVCDVIAESLTTAYEKAPAGSTAKANLGRTRAYYRRIWDAMALGWIQRWWDSLPPRAGLMLNVSSSGHNATYSALNARSKEGEASDVQTTT